MEMKPLEHLTRFVMTVDDFEKTPLMLKRFSSQFTMNYNNERQSLNWIFNQPEDNDLRASLLHLRSFICSDNDPFNISNIYNFCYKRILSLESKQRLGDLRKKWKKSLKDWGLNGFKFVFNNQTFTPKDITNLYINGFYFHNDFEKMKIIEAMGGTPAEALSITIMIGLMEDAIVQVEFLKNFILTALKDGQFNLDQIP